MITHYIPAELWMLPDLWTAAGLALAGTLGMLAAGRAVRRELKRLDVY